MKSHRSLALACMVLALGADHALAQFTPPTTTPTTTIPTTTPTTTTTPTSTTQTQQLTVQGVGMQSQTTLSLVATNSGAGTATSWPSNTNPFVGWYGDAMSMGKADLFTTGPQKPKATFGKGIYTSATNTSPPTSKAAASQQNGFNTLGQPRAPQYSTVLSDDVPVVVHESSALRDSVRAVIERSSYLKSKNTVQVSVNGGAIVQLTGSVASEKERRTIEGMVRMTPGVRAVQNSLSVQAK